MSEIEAGEWIRTKKGQIDKAIDFDEEKIIIRCKKYKFWIESVVKHSHNIIDLIEPGDYVNGCKVKEVEDNKIREYRAKEGLPNLECYYKEWNGVYYLDNISIKSILTKEQFAQNCYEMEE